MGNILIIDDSAVQRTILKKFLESDGHTVVGESSSGQDAIRMYKKYKPDILMLDVVLFDANGVNILNEIMNYDKHANVIMFSSTALKNVIEESIQLGAKDFLVKPITADTLTRTVNNVMEMRKSTQRN